MSDIRVRSDNSAFTEGRVYPPPGPLAVKFTKPAGTLWKGTLTKGSQVVVSREDGNGYSTPEFSFGNLATGDYALNIRILGNATKTVRFSIRTSAPPPPQPPRILSQPAGVSVTVGEAADLDITVDDANATFQWYRNGVPVPYEEDSTFSIYEAQLADAGSYVCVATNSGGSVASSAAIVEVRLPAPPQILSQPTGTTVTVGEGFDLTMGVDDFDATFQWYKNGASLPGETDSTYSNYEATLADAGSYVCVASNLGGNTSSNEAIVVVRRPAPPQILRQPGSVTVMAGEEFTLSIEVDVEDATFQWYENGNPLADEIDSNFTVHEAEPGDSGAYRCTVTNAGGSEESSAAQVTVRSPTPPVITEQPTPITVRKNGSAQFTVAAEGTGELTYQWFKNGVELDETEDTLSLDELSVSDAGKYHVTVTNAGGSVTSRVVALVVESGFKAGQYAGLFQNPYEVRHESSGSMKITVTKEGRFTGSAQIGALKYRFAGNFDEDGSAAFEAGTKKAGEETLELNITLDEEDRILGSVATSGWDSELLLQRNPFSAASPCPSAGIYTVLLAPDDSNEEAPPAYGFLTMKIASNGTVTASGKLADGTRAAASGFIGAEGDIPLYVPLYAGKGTALGWLNVSDEGATGAITWTKPASATGVYTEGFVTTMESLGAPYLKDESSLPSDAVLILGGADLEDSMTVPITTARNGRIVTGRGVRIQINANGSFSGTYTKPGSRRSIAFSGALYQPAQAGFGFFKSAGQIGEVYVGAPLEG